jgi:hypothetical protein
MNLSGISPTSSQVGPRLDERACLVSMGFALGSSVQIRPSQLNCLALLAKISTNHVICMWFP